MAVGAGLRRHFRLGVALGEDVIDPSRAADRRYEIAEPRFRNLSPLSTSSPSSWRRKPSREGRDSGKVALPLLGRFLPDLGPASAGLLCCPIRAPCRSAARGLRR